MNAIKRIVFVAEAVTCVGGADEATFESVGPTVIATLDPSGEMPFGAGTNAGTTMSADVEKCAKRVTPVPGNDDAFTRDLAQKIIAWRRDLVGAPGADPGLAVESFEFVAEDIGVCVVAGG